MCYVWLDREPGVEVVAEGIETAAEAAALLSLGVDYGQGWHFGRPGAPEALSEITEPAAAIPAPRRAAAEAASHRPAAAGTAMRVLTINWACSVAGRHGDLDDGSVCRWRSSCTPVVPPRGRG